jgi:hypothetical protein
MAMVEYFKSSLWECLSCELASKIVALATHVYKWAFPPPSPIIPLLWLLILGEALLLKFTLDVIQFYLERQKCHKFGKAIGAIGNTIAGWRFGSALDGTVDGTVGAIVGIIVWCLDTWIESRPASVVLAKGTARIVASKIGEEVVKRFAKKKAGEFGKEVIVTVLTKYGSVLENAAARLSKLSAAEIAESMVINGNILGVVADAAQTGLECCGYKGAGVAVGATGNIVSGALAGFALGGSTGAVIGSVVGAWLWLIGEARRKIFLTP